MTTTRPVPCRPRKDRHRSSPMAGDHCAAPVGGQDRPGRGASRRGRPWSYPRKDSSTLARAEGMAHCKGHRAVRLLGSLDEPGCPRQEQLGSGSQPARAKRHVPLQKVRAAPKPRAAQSPLVARASRHVQRQRAVARSAPVPAGSAGKKMTGALTSIAPVRAVHKSEVRKDACAARTPAAGLVGATGATVRGGVILLADGRAALPEPRPRTHHALPNWENIALEKEKKNIARQLGPQWQQEKLENGTKRWRRV
ncbi:hypothetical protein PVAP13_6KG318006 [Panicum virgatum]|uniref:Uncharacterized protein n=1 Tax=Panicum virgatum TaxID=38727 RepID=A0A8T0RHG2_PANVG|nr:hypothetical protein PVAP13_6KG318006 [Panicum virgatum]